jgi:hypothetical protein
MTANPSSIARPAQARDQAPAPGASQAAHLAGPLASIAWLGTGVSVATAAILGLVASAAGRSPVRVVNSTSHWFHGDRGARTATVDLSHTAAGWATHHGASLFWAAVFEAVRRVGPRRSVIADATLVSALAAFVDYAVVPKRLTPGWEKVVSPGAIALAYGAMALALAAGTLTRDRRG